MNDKWYLSGPLAIGTTEPKRALHVEGNGIHSGGTLAGLSFHNRESPGFADTPTTGERWVWYSSCGTARLWSGNDKLTISKEGNVGIGSSALAGRLQFDNGTGNKVIFFDNGEADRYGLGLSANNLNVFIPAGARFSIRERSFDGTEVMAVTSSGNVRIGTNDSKTKLDVAGDINVTGNITASVIKSLEDRVTQLEQEIMRIKNGPTKVKSAESSDKAFTSDIAIRLQCRPNHFIKWENTTGGNQEVFVFEIGYGGEEKWQIKESGVLVPWW